MSTPTETCVSPEHNPTTFYSRVRRNATQRVLDWKDTELIQLNCVILNDWNNH
jgi:hypothetical protein